MTIVKRCSSSKGESIPLLSVEARTEIGVLGQEHEEIHIFSFYIFIVGLWMF
jgi:hypothetical protein